MLLASSTDASTPKFTRVEYTTTNTAISSVATLAQQAEDTYWNFSLQYVDILAGVGNLIVFDK